MRAKFLRERPYIVYLITLYWNLVFFFFYNIEPPVSSEKTISFIHCFDLEGEAFKEEVLRLYDRFGQCLGYRCHLDKLETIQVAENKFRYVLNNVQNSNFVFICVSPELKRIFDSSHKEISNSLDGWSWLLNTN